MKKDVHVMPKNNAWKVKTENTQKAAKITSTQKEAIEKAVQIARNKHSDVVIHDRKNKIREKNSYGNDSYPPKG